MEEKPFQIREIDENDRAWVRERSVELWGGDFVVAHGDLFHPADLPGFIAESEQIPIGWITYQIREETCEIITLDSLKEGVGVGSALFDAVEHAAHGAECCLLTLVTSNDNLHALGWYQRRGMRISAIHPNALVEVRRLKPSVPIMGMNGIPLMDELVLEKEIEP
ncbi:MAG: GNAT family N-acetyltransferase [Anaerolineaceae bacterium]|nr:GNAT family N-acetyltransferase [Anaerolineaceae bacterium]